MHRRSTDSRGYPEESSYKWVVLFITTLGSFMTPLDSSIVGIALPSIASSLRIDYAAVLWVPTVYLLCLTVFLLSFGRIADMRGRKLPFILGFVMFTAASVACSASQNGIQLIMSRATQGVGGALICATSPAIVTDVFPSEERGKALGINAMAVYTGLSVGPTLGGFLVQSLGWRSIFYINLPIGTFVVGLSLLKLQESSISSSRERFDWLGAGTFSIGLTGLLLALTLGAGYGWASSTILSFWITSVVFLLLFGFAETRMGEEAILNISLFFKNRLFAAANITALLNYTAHFAVVFLISFYLQRVLNYSPVQAGLILLPMPLTMAVLSPVSGWLSDRVGSRILSSAGMGFVCFALFLLSNLSTSASALDVSVRLLILGVGNGLFAPPNTSAVMGSVEKGRLSVAASTLATMRFLGQSVSLALAGAVAATTVSSKLLSDLFIGIGALNETIMSEAFVEGIRRALTASGVVAAIGIFTSLIRGKGK